MLGALGTHASDPEPHIYLHGSSVARLSRLTSNTGPTGLPVCVSSTILDGYVLALSPYNHSCNYRSAVIFGHATFVTDADEALWAMELLTNQVTPSRWANSRTPPTRAEMTATAILKVRIETASAKRRARGPESDRKDAKDAETVARVWTGVVPVYQVLGEPVEAPDNAVKEVPGYVQQWTESESRKAREIALEGATG